MGYDTLVTWRVSRLGGSHGCARHAAHPETPLFPHEPPSKWAVLEGDLARELCNLAEPSKPNNNEGTT